MTHHKHGVMGSLWWAPDSSGYATHDDKGFCCVFLLAILRVDPAENLAKYKR